MARSVLTFERAVRGLTTCGVQFASQSESVDTSTQWAPSRSTWPGRWPSSNPTRSPTGVRAANRHLASKSRAASGGRRCFGYNRDGSVNSEEAELLREAARRFLDGATLTAVVKGWNTQGVRTPSGNEWGPSVLGQLLRAERIAGMRRHGEQVFTGDWEPIIDRGTFYALAEALGDSKRRTVRLGIKRHLPTGIPRCGLCGQGMGTRVPKAGQGVRYACVNAPGRRGCGRVTIVARPVEDIVERIVLRSPLLFQCAANEVSVSEARGEQAASAAGRRPGDSRAVGQGPPLGAPHLPSRVSGGPQAATGAHRRGGASDRSGGVAAA